MKIEILHFDKFKFDHEEQLHDIYIKRISQFRNIITDIKTCLLYTSPSPRDRTRSRMPSSA